MTNSDSITLETAHALWGAERYDNLAKMATTMFNEWVANPEREADTWYGEADFDINLYDDDDGNLKAVLYFLKDASPDISEQHYDKFITIAEQQYAPLGFTLERFAYIKKYAKSELVDFMSGDKERTYRGETWDGDFELCFDTDETDADRIVIELYKRVDDDVQYDDCYEFNYKELLTLD